ncbi:hypothetical protein F3Y22_tig00111392pilonHSYRG00178 [Hibiscus syriacus]|uniref:CCHC-type domain-containing protein n=1 Tax=Hibiscus syriacus TaxID=106335 RepID=A0A6A2XWC0_HIBSY|nr:hypothetical protein F3Y22_tig00111392pilonHSYRG00178 [Hibiscus syriacus]
MAISQNDGNADGNFIGPEVLVSPQLERPGSPFMDEDQRATKKVRNKEEVDRMEEDHADLEAQSNTYFNDKIAGNQGKHSYASAVMGNSKTMVDVVSLKAMDEVEILDGECIVDNNGPYPVIHFADQVHDRIDYSMRRSVIVRLLGRAIGYKTLLNRIGVLWKLQGQYQLIDLENDYFLVKFEREEEICVLMEGPWTIFGSYLTVQPWSRTFSTLEKHPSQVIVWVRLPGLPYRYYSKAIFRRIAMVIGQVVKIDYSTNFVSFCSLGGLQQICFQCGVYGHSKENCGSVEGSTRHEGLAGEPSVVPNNSLGSEDTGFGPWMIAETRKRRPKKVVEQNTKGSNVEARGSRFAILNEINNGQEEVTAVVSDAPAEEHNKRNGEVYASRMENQAKGKVVTDSVPLEASSGRRTNTNRKEDVGDSRALNQISVIAMEEGAIPQVTKSRYVTADGSHSVVSISDDSRNNINKRNNRGNGSRREVGEGNKGLKVRKNKDFSFSPAVLTDWLKNAKVNTKHDKVTLHDEGSSVQRENEHEETLSHAKETLSTIPEEDISLERENGVGSPKFRRHLREHCRESRPDLVALLETRISGINADKVIQRLGFQNSFRVEAHGFSGGIWILWKDGLDVEILTISNQFIHGRCWSDNENRWLYFTAIYASPQVEKRKLIWKHLTELMPGENEAWLLGGDFNSILRLDEREGGSSRGSGDHPQFKDFLSEVWRNDLDALTNVNSFQSKASEWNLNVFGHIGRKKRELLARLRGIDRALITRYSQRLVDLQHVLEYELEQVLQQEESLWLQKSRTQWVLHGDKNTKYFHACTMMRRRRNHVGALKDMNAQEVIHSMRLKKDKVGFMAIKIDLEKAYDRLEWFSCQKINMQKTTIFYSKNVDSGLKSSISSLFGFQEVQNLDNQVERFALPRRTVASMVDTNGQWRWELISNLAPDSIQQRLASTMPPRQDNRNDALGWKWTVDRCFSVKSAYERKHVTPDTSPHKVWKVISKYRGLQRIKVFLWDIRDWLQINIANPGIYARDDCDWDLLFSSILWLIWKNRNRRIFDPDYIEHESILAQGRRLCFEAKRAIETNLQTNPYSFQRISVPNHWTPPPTNWCKVNTDGSRKLGNVFATCGGVIRSSNGGWILGFSKVLGICSIVEAELWGIHEGLSHAWNLGERQIMVEADNLEVIRMLKGKTNKGSIFTLLDRVNELLKQEWTVTLRHINRDVNKVADKTSQFSHSRRLGSYGFLLSTFGTVGGYNASYGNPEAGYSATIQSSVDVYPQYGPASGFWGACDMQRAQGHR